MGRVRIGTCSGPADAALVRSVFSAHGVPVAIGAEEHANMLGGLGGGFLRLDISVDEADAEEAVALLADMREGEHEAAPDAHEVDDADGTDESWKREPVEDAPADDGEPDPAAPDPVAARIDRRRRTMVALLLGCCVSFGTAHMFTRAWLRGMVLAGVEALGFSYVSAKPPLAAALVIGAIVLDVAGSLTRIWSGGPGLPVARVRR